MEPKDSLPHLQVPATCPSPEPHWSSPCPPSHSLMIHLNIILPPICGCSTWSLSLCFPHQNPAYTPPLPQCATCSAHLILLGLITIIIIGEEYRSLSSSLCSFLHSSVTSSLLGPNNLLSTLFSNILNLQSSLNVSNQFSHPYKTTGKIIVLYILIFIFLERNPEDKRFCTKWQ